MSATDYFIAERQKKKGYLDASRLPADSGNGVSFIVSVPIDLRPESSTNFANAQRSSEPSKAPSVGWSRDL